MKEIIMALIAGFGCGLMFSMIGLPIPAPPVFAGVAGIIGVWAGYSVIMYLRRV